MTADRDSRWSLPIESIKIDHGSISVSGGEHMTGWCWDMRAEPYEDEDQDDEVRDSSEGRREGSEQKPVSWLPVGPL
jgi:hypothetical protein